MDTVKEYIELIAALMLPLGFIGFMWHRIATKKAIGVRAVQFIAVVFLLPIILILGMEKLLDGQTLAALIGGLIGYLLSGLSNFDRQPLDGSN